MTTWYKDYDSYITGESSFALVTQTSGPLSSPILPAPGWKDEKGFNRKIAAGKMVPVTWVRKAQGRPE